MWLRLVGASRVYSSAVEHRIADPAVAGSIPAAPLINTFWNFLPPGVSAWGTAAGAVYVSLWPNWTRRLTTNQKIGGSSPSRDNFLPKKFPFAGKIKEPSQMGFEPTIFGSGNRRLIH